MRGFPLEPQDLRHVIGGLGVQIEHLVPDKFIIIFP